MNGISTPEDDKDFSITNVLAKQLTDPSLQNGVGKSDIVTINGNGFTKHLSSSSDDCDNDISPAALCSDNRASFSTPEGKSQASTSEAWCDANNNSTSDISELSLPDSLLCEMGSDGVSFTNTSASSSVINDNAIKHPVLSHLTSDTTKHRSKSESPSSSLKRSRKVSAPENSLSSFSMEIPSIDDDDDAIENFSLRRSKYTPIRRKRNSVAGSCPSFEKFGDLGPVSHLLNRLEESGETDGSSLKSSPELLRKAIGHKSTMPTTAGGVQTKHVVHGKPIDEIDKGQVKPVAKTKSDVVTAKPPLPLSKTDSSGSVKQKKKSVKGIFSKRMSSKSLNPPPVEPVAEQPPKDVTKPKVKKAIRRAPLSGIISRLSPKRDIPSKSDDKPAGNKKEETKHKQPRKLSMTKSSSQSGGSVMSQTSSSNSITSADAFRGQKSSSFTITKEPLKSSPSETSFASREASISVESLLSDGSTDILLAHSNHDLFATSSREDLLDDCSITSSQHQHTGSETLPSDVNLLDDPPLKLEEITLITDEDDVGPSPAILVTSPTKNQDKKLVPVKDSPVHHRVREIDGGHLYKAKSMEVLSSSHLMTEVEVLTSTTPASNLPSTVSVSTENLSSALNKWKGNITVSTVKKCASLDVLAVSKKQSPTTMITVSSRKTPTKVKPTTVTGNVQKAEVKEEKKEVVQEKDKASNKVPVKSGAAVQRSVASNSPALSRQGSGRKLSTTSSSFTRTSSRASTGRRKSNAMAPAVSDLSVSAKRSNSPAKKTNIVVKSTRVNPTTSKVVVTTKTSTLSKPTDSNAHPHPQRVVSPTKSSGRRPSMQRVSSAGRKKSTSEKATTAKSPVMQSPSPQHQQRPKIPFVSLFQSRDSRRLGRVSSDERPANNTSKTDAVHCRSSSEIVTNGAVGGLTDIVENQLLVTSSVETLSSDRVTSSMSDTTGLQKASPTDTPVRRISSGPQASKPPQTSPGSQTPVRKRSVTGQTRPLARVEPHSSITQHQSDSALKRPGSASARRTSSTARPSTAGTLPRQLMKTKSDSKIDSSTLPRVRKISDQTSPEATTGPKRSVRPHSAAVSRGGSQAVARSSARRISLVPSSSAGRVARSSTRRSKSTVTPPDVDQLKVGEGHKTTDEVDGAKVSKSTSGSLLNEVKPKSQELSRKVSSTLRSSGRRTSTASKPAADGGNLKDARSSTLRSSRRMSHHSVAAKATSMANVTHSVTSSVTPNKRMSLDRRGSAFSTPKQESSVSMSDLDAVKSADRYSHCNIILYLYGTTSP